VCVYGVLRSDMVLMVVFVYPERLRGQGHHTLIPIRSGTHEHQHQKSISSVHPQDKHERSMTFAKYKEHTVVADCVGVFPLI
jgi:hypothetical protein